MNCKILFANLVIGQEITTRLCLLYMKKISELAMTKSKNSLSRNRLGKWQGELSCPIRLPADAKDSQQLEAAKTIDERMKLLANRYGIKLDRPEGWRFLAYFLAIDCVPGMWVEQSGRNHHPSKHDEAYQRDIGLAYAWALRTLPKHGASKAAAKLVARTMQDDRVDEAKRVRQVQNTIAKLSAQERAAFALIVDNFFKKHPDSDESFS